MSAQGALWGLATPGVQLSHEQLRRALLALVDEEPRSADQLAAASGVPGAIARNVLCSLALEEGLLVCDADGRYHRGGEAP